MCFFYALSKDAQSLKNRYQLGENFEFDSEPGFLTEFQYYVSGFDFPKMPVITDEQSERIQGFNWGLIPSWVKTPDEAAKMRFYNLNARSETVFTKPSFREAIRKRRCLVPADGFYEWRLFQGKKYPYFIYLKSKEAFSFAGIWETWVDRSSGEVMNTFGILTTEANSLLERIHNTKKRMPVILPQESERHWIKRELTQTELLALTKPFDEDLMEAHTISKLITSKHPRNIPAIQEVLQYPELKD